MRENQESTNFYSCESCLFFFQEQISGTDTIMRKQNRSNNRSAGAGNEHVNKTNSERSEALSERFPDQVAAEKSEEDIDAQTLRRLLEP